MNKGIKFVCVEIIVVRVEITLYVWECLNYTCAYENHTMLAEITLDYSNATCRC
jgi:hypothetical protein